jgi:tRNA (guanine-N7-)-methyltransferase
MTATFVRDIERTLGPGGTLHFWTDVEEYFQETLALLAAETKLTGPLPVAERPAEDQFDYHTHFERRMRLHEKPVYRAECRKALG